MASPGSVAHRLAWSLCPAARRLGTATEILISRRCLSSVAQGAGKLQEDAAVQLEHTDSQSTLGQYIALHPHRIPEAFPQLHNAFYLPKQGGKPQHPEGTEPPLPRKGGCKGLQLEMKVAGSMPVHEWDASSQQAGLEASSSGGSGEASEGAAVQGPAVMWRQCMWGLEQHLQRVHSSSSSSSSQQEPEGEDTGGRQLRMLLEGPSGSGKSIALATMVERRRAANWLVLYVPSATALTWGGYFVPRSFPSADGAEVTRYDTLISAQHILLGMKQAHGEQLQGLPIKSVKSQQVLQAAQGQSSPSPSSPSPPPPAPPSSASASASASASPASSAAAEGASTSTQPSDSSSGLGVNRESEAGQQASSDASEQAQQAGQHSEEGLQASSAKSEGGEGSVSASGSEQQSGGSEGGSEGEEAGALQSASLLDLVMAGLSTDVDAALAVDACLALMHELDLVAESGQYQVLIAVDDFNALHEDVPTGYGVWQGAEPKLGGAGAAAAEGRLSRRPLRVEELTLASAVSNVLRQQGPKYANVMCSVTATSAQLKDMSSLARRARKKSLPLYSMTEVANTLQHYYKCGALTHPPSRHLANRMWALTGGNAAQLRQVPQASLLEGKKDHKVHLTRMEYHPQLPRGAQTHQQML